MKLKNFIFLHEDERRLIVDLEIDNPRTFRPKMWHIIVTMGDEGFFLDKESQKRWHAFMDWLIASEIEINYLREV